MAYAERTKGKLTGRWCADVTYACGNGLSKRYHKAFKSKGEAEGFEAYVRATGEVPPHVVGKPTNSFASVAERCKARNVEWANERVTAQRLQFAIDRLGDLDVRVIRTHELEKYVDHLQKHCGRAGQTPANNTINNYLSVVGKVLAYAHRLDLIEGLPAMPRMAMTGKKRAAVSWAMENAICQRLQSTGKETYAFLVRTLGATGMRRGELYALRPEQIETPERIEHTGWMLTKEQTKTDAARWVPFPPAAAKKLRALIASNALPTPTQLSDTFRATTKALGDKDGLTLHCLRHTTVTRLEATGVEPLIIAKLVGHSTGLMTERYFKPEKDRLFAVAEKVHSGLGELPKTGEVVAMKPLDNQALAG
jgi:integrase